MKKKNIVKLTESDLEKVIFESVQKILKEDYNSNPLYEYYYNMIDVCGNIILQTQTKGRRFIPREIGELQNDQQFMQLRQELLEKMEGYFYATKELLGYVANKCQEDGEASLVNSAQKWLDKEYSPEW